MNSKNLKTVLEIVKNLVKKNRIAYKDYLGKETVDEVICEGVCQDNPSPLTIKKNEKLQPGKMYQVAIDGVVSSWTCKEEYNFIGIGPFVEYVIEHGKEPTDSTGMWMIEHSSADALVVVAEPSFAGKTFVVSQIITRKKIRHQKTSSRIVAGYCCFLG